MYICNLAFLFFVAWIAIVLLCLVYTYFLFLSLSVIARCFVSFILVKFFFTSVFMLLFCLFKEEEEREREEGKREIETKGDRDGERETERQKRKKDRKRRERKRKKRERERERADIELRQRERERERGEGKRERGREIERERGERERQRNRETERKREKERFTHFSVSSKRHSNCSGCNSTFVHRFHTCFVYLASGFVCVCQDKTVLDADTIRGHEKEKEDCMDLKIAKRIGKLIYEK